jgi:hypothetical protein
LRDRKKIFQRFFTAIIPILLVILIVILLFEPIATVFNITANTERIKIRTIKPNSSRLIFEDVEIADLYEITDSSFNGSLQLNKGVEVTVERVAGGPLIIEFRSNKSTGKLYNAENNFLKDTPEFFEVVIKDMSARSQEGKTVLFPIEGDIDLGRSVDFEVLGEYNSILRGGELAMTGISGIFGERFDAGARELLLGDQLIFEDVKHGALGFVTVNENPGIQVAYRISALHAKILKPGIKDSESGTKVKARPLDRFLNAPFFQGLSLFFGSLVIMLTIGSFLMDFRSFLKDKS